MSFSSAPISPASISLSCSSPRSSSSSLAGESSPLASLMSRIDSPLERSPSAPQYGCTPSPRSPLSGRVSAIPESEGPTATFNRVFSGATTLSDHEKLSLLHDYSRLQGMKEDSILELFTSLEVPMHTPHLSTFIKSEKNKKALFHFCWENQLLKSLGGLALQLSSLGLVPFIQAEMKGPITPVKLRMVSELVPFFQKDMVDFLFAFFKGLSVEQRELPEVALLQKEFLFHKPACAYLTEVTSHPALEDLTLGFSVYWNCVGLSKNQLANFEVICQKIYLLNNSLIDDLIQDFLKNNPLSLPTMIAYTLECLSRETIGLIRERIDLMTAQGAKCASKAKEFIACAQTKSLMVWSYLSDESLRNFTWIAKGTQIGKDGIVDQEKAIEVWRSLSKNAHDSIQFDIHRICNVLSGGVCSAMTFRALKLYREARAHCATPTEVFTSIAPNFQNATEEFREIQATYNSIQRKDVSADFKKAKIEAILKYENPQLSIIKATNEIDLYSGAVVDLIGTEFDHLADGLFVVRALCPLGPDEDYFDTDPLFLKGEEHGHSTLLIKEKGETFYYDPALGFIQLDQPAGQLAMVLNWQNARWKVHKVRFYQVS